jgi:hypothetical protein
LLWKESVTLILHLVTDGEINEDEIGIKRKEFKKGRLLKQIIFG